MKVLKKVQKGWGQGSVPISRKHDVVLDDWESIG